MNKITFAIFTYNEEKRIAYAVKNFIRYGDVVILDGGSADRTQEIAESLGAKFFTRPKSDRPFVETQENFDFLKSKIRTDWIYWGYADNIAPKTLVEKLVAVSGQDKVKMVLIPLHAYLWGDVRHFALKSYAPMFFHKDFVTFADNHIHGLGKFLGAKDQSLKLPDNEKYALKHFSTYTINKFLLGNLRYSDEEALQKYRAGKKFSVVRTLAAMARYVWIYGKYNCKNGALGMLIVLNHAFARLITYTRLYELEHNITLENIENTYSKEKEKMLEDFK